MRFFAFSSVSALVLGASAALAGGVVSPVADVEPVTVTPVARIASAWSGVYVGGSLGYSFWGDDTIGLDLVSNGDLIGRGTDLGDADFEGVTAGAHVGYRWQRGTWVFGPELGIEGGSVDGGEDVSAFGLDGTIESKVNYIVSLVMKTGYEMTPGTLIYGTIGVAHGDFDYIGTVADDSQSVGYSGTGYAIGLGIERKMNERMSVFAEYQYRDFGREDLSFVLDSGENVETLATPTHSNVKLGVNFTF